MTKMKNNQTDNVEFWYQTINEWLLELPEMCPAHSTGKPDVPTMINNIDVRFAPDSSLQIQIRHFMKTSPLSAETPFTDLMLHPDKLAAALQAAKKENDAFAASRIFSRSALGHDTKDGSPDTDDAGKPFSRELAEQSD
jgi:hypothetical protein